MAKRSLCMLLAAAAVFALAAPAFAQEGPVEEPIVPAEPVVEAEPVILEEPSAAPEEEPVIPEEAPVAAQEPEPLEELAEPGELAPIVLVDEPMPAAETTTDSGKCGDGVTWTLTGDGVLNITGAGGINDNAFSGRSDIKTVVIQEGVTSIGEWAFNGCHSLRSITIPDSVTSIGIAAFQGCDSLTSITIPAGVTSIGAAAAFNASGMMDIYVDSNSKSFSSVDGVLFNANKTELICYPRGKTAASYAIPSTVKSIGESAFMNCYSLKSVTIPDSVTSIGSYAFASSNLTGITIPASVTNIGIGAFQGCVALTSVTVENVACVIAEGQSTFGDFGTAVISGYAGSTAEAFANKFGYKFEAIDSAAGSTGSAEPATLATPKLSSVTNTANGIQIKWGAVTGAERYLICYKTTGGWKKLATTTKTSYLATKAKDGVKYTFTVRCVSADGKTYTSGFDAAGQTITCKRTSLATPKLSSVTNTASGIQIKWGRCPGRSGTWCATRPPAAGRSWPPPPRPATWRRRQKTASSTPSRSGASAPTARPIPAALTPRARPSPASGPPWPPPS